MGMSLPNVLALPLPAGTGAGLRALVRLGRGGTGGRADIDAATTTGMRMRTVYATSRYGMSSGLSSERQWGGMKM